MAVVRFLISIARFEISVASPPEAIRDFNCACFDSFEAFDDMTAVCFANNESFKFAIHSSKSYFIAKRKRPVTGRNVAFSMTVLSLNR